MLICPKCRTTYSSSLGGACYRDGEKLVDHEAFVAAENDPMRNRLIGGKYRIVERVGQGGMGTVYRATQTGLNRDVAVKILKRELNVDRDTVARFHREANAMSLLTHPNTVRVYDFGQTDDGLLYLVMELLEGELITQKLSREGALDVLEAVRFTQQILRSLAEAHKKNIVHRDLKPDNIFVVHSHTHTHDASVIKVLDFGIAKVVAPDRQLDQFETQAGTVFGTPRYMSPEQAQGSQLDGRSDLYSVGTLLYQMLTGRAPFVDDDAVVVMAKHIRELADPPRKAAPDRPIPESLETVVMRALAKDPGARFQEAAEFDAALEGCVPDVLAAASSPRKSDLGFRNAPPGPLVWGLLGLSVLGMGFLGYRAYAPNHSTARERSARQSVGSDAEAVAGAESSEADKPVRIQAQGPGTQGEGPARVKLRSDPEGAVVMREGRKVGKTPLELLVPPEEEIVRVELHRPGFVPLAAELTATDGERVLELAKVPEEPATPSKSVKSSRSRRRGSSRGVARANRKSATESSETPSGNGGEGREPGGPYERFE